MEREDCSNQGAEGGLGRIGNELVTCCPCCCPCAAPAAAAATAAAVAAADDIRLIPALSCSTLCKTVLFLIISGPKTLHLQ